MANRAESSAETIIAFQVAELKRLLRENRAMSDRVDTLNGEISRLRAMHEKEQAKRCELQDAVVNLMHKVVTPESVAGTVRRTAKPALREIRGGQPLERISQRSGSLSLAQQRAEARQPEIPAFLRRAAH